MLYSKLRKSRGQLKNPVCKIAFVHSQFCPTAINFHAQKLPTPSPVHVSNSRSSRTNVRIPVTLVNNQSPTSRRLWSLYRVIHTKYKSFTLKTQLKTKNN